MTEAPHDCLARLAALEAALAGHKENTINSFVLRDREVEGSRREIERYAVLTNEIRGAMMDAQQRFTGKEAHEVVIKSLEDHAARLAALETKFYLGGAGIMAIMVLLQIGLNFVLRH